jgi:hypothetical protein
VGGFLLSSRKPGPRDQSLYYCGLRICPADSHPSGRFPDSDCGLKKIQSKSKTQSEFHNGHSAFPNPQSIDSRRLPHEGKTSQASSRGGLNSGLHGPDSLMSNQVSPFPLHVLFAYCNLPSLPANRQEGSEAKK